jgi:hypothetical protein
MPRKHAHIPDNDYWGICLFHVVWTNFFCNYSYVVHTKYFFFFFCITLKIHSKADFKSKSQNIWQQIILFSRTVKQNWNDMCVTQDLNSFGEIIAHAHCSVDEKDMQISYLYYACIHIRLITCCWFNHYYRMTTFKIETSWPWSYGGWIYNYLCNRCLTPLMFWVQIPLNARGTTLCDKVCR